MVLETSIGAVGNPPASLLVRSSPGDVHQRFKPFQLAVHRILWCHGGGWEASELTGEFREVWKGYMWNMWYVFRLCLEMGKKNRHTINGIFMGLRAPTRARCRSIAFATLRRSIFGIGAVITVISGIPWYYVLYIIYIIIIYIYIYHIITRISTITCQFQQNYMEKGWFDKASGKWRQSSRASPAVPAPKVS